MRRKFPTDAQFLRKYYTYMCHMNERMPGSQIEIPRKGGQSSGALVASCDTVSGTALLWELQDGGSNLNFVAVSLT